MGVHQLGEKGQLLGKLQSLITGDARYQLLKGYWGGSFG